MSSSRSPETGKSKSAAVASDARSLFGGTTWLVDVGAPLFVEPAVVGDLVERLELFRAERTSVAVVDEDHREALLEVLAQRDGAATD